MLVHENLEFLDFSNSLLEDRNYVDWKTIDERTNRKRFRHYWQTNSVYQAEALVYEKVPPDAISKIVTNSEETMDRVCNEIYENTDNDMWLELPVDIAPEYYK